MRSSDSLRGSSLAEIVTWTFASLALMGVLSIGFSGAGRTEDAATRASNCRVSPAWGDSAERPSVLFELNGALLRLKCRDGANVVSTDQKFPRARRAPVSATSGLMNRGGVPVVVPAPNNSLLYYLPEEDGYVTGDRAAD